MARCYAGCSRKSPVLSQCAECGCVLLSTRDPVRQYCNNECKSAFQKRAKPVTKEWLQQKYVSEGLDCVEIAAIVSRDPKSVWNWLVDFGIPRRNRGYATSLTWVKRGIKQPSHFKGKKHKPETIAKLRAIAIADGRIPFDPKIGPPYRGKRGSEIPSWKGGVTPERQAFYNTEEWKAVRKLVYGRDKNACQCCGRDRKFDKYITFAIHHIVSFCYAPLRAELSNLILLCRDCHLWVHSNWNTKQEFIKEIPSDVIAA